MCYGIPNTYMLCINIHYGYQCYISITLVEYKTLLKQCLNQFVRLLKYEICIVCLVMILFYNRSVQVT
jgi:hypothetical protein